MRLPRSPSPEDAVLATQLGVNPAESLAFRTGKYIGIGSAAILAASLAFLLIDHAPDGQLDQPEIIYTGYGIAGAGTVAALLLTRGPVNRAFQAIDSHRQQG